MRSHLIIPDPHAHYKHHNRRAEWLGHLINDLKPDVVVNMGDTADLPSLSGYDKGKKSFQGRTYRADVDAAVDFTDRLWGVVRAAKRRMPLRAALIGNHEDRITRCIDLQPELDGAVTLDDLKYKEFYDIVVPYEGRTPGSIEIDGVTYAHYFPTGVSGFALGGEHPAARLVAKNYTSSTAAHSHLVDLAYRTAANGKKIIGCVAGCYQDYVADWAGKELQRLWWSGVVFKQNVQDGVYDPRFISLASIKKEYDK